MIDQRENASWQAICNGFGAGFGNFIGNAGFLILESKDFCNDHLRPLFKLPRQNRGIVTVESI